MHTKIEVIASELGISSRLREVGLGDKLVGLREQIIMNIVAE
jgi:hypothetical protein